MLTPSGSRVCAEAGVPAANAAAVANPSDSADLLSIFVIAVPFGCFGPLGQSLGPWFETTLDIQAKRNQRFACGAGAKSCKGARRKMSATGHSRRFDRTTATSGLPRRTDILRISGHVSKVPTTDSCAAANSIAIRSPLLRSKQSSKRKGRLYFTLAQTGWAVDEEAVPQSLGTAVRTKPRRSRALKPSEGSWFSHERRSR